ncbi:nucleolar protein 9 isoform X2 [Struthio camelus]|uniref:nucleolar protein 9 isoform X2 n=1 Tax=Struthio camelus TaxID=8801 RepID=UPI003603CAAC
MGVRRRGGSAPAPGPVPGAEPAPTPVPAPRLDPGTAAYFRRALETLQEGLSPEELELFAPNVLAEAAAAGPAAAALDPAASRVLQSLLPRAPAGVLGRVLGALAEGGLGGPAGHPLGARVLEAALAGVAAAGAEASGQLEVPQEQVEMPQGQLEVAEGQLEAPGQLVVAVGQLVDAVGGDLVAFARHPAGSFVVRALLRALGAGAPQLPQGVGLKDKGAEPAAEGVGLKAEGAGPPPAFLPLLGQLAAAFEDKLPALLSPAPASLCLQVALEVLHRSQSPACARLCAALIGCLAPPGSAPCHRPLVEALQDPERSRLAEAAMTVAGPRVLRRLYREHLRGRLRDLARHRVANHGLQRLLDHAPANVVGEALAELGPALAEPLAQGHPGVLTALAGACRRHSAHQQEALRHLFQAFECWEPPGRRRACVGLLAGLRPFGGGASVDEGAEPQHLLHFEDPGPVLGGLEALPPPALAALACSPPGSHVWDALLASPTVPARPRRRLLRKLKGHFVSLACHRNGSRVLDAIWAASAAPARAAIATELVAQREALQRDPHGRGVARALALDLFARRRCDWERLQAAPARRRALLGAILED